MDQRLASATADEIRGLMAKQHKTQAQLASVLGISQAAVSRKFHEGRFNLNDLGAIADWLGVSIIRLFGEPGSIAGTGADTGARRGNRARRVKHRQMVAATAHAA